MNDDIIEPVEPEEEDLAAKPVDDEDEVLIGDLKPKDLVDSDQIDPEDLLDDDEEEDDMEELNERDDI